MAVFSRLTAPGIRLFRQGFKNVNQQVRRSGDSHWDSHMNIIASKWTYLQFKDLLHFYTIIVGAPLLAIITYANIFVGSSKLAAIPEGYEPEDYEYEPHPITRWFLKNVYITEQERYERMLHVLWEQDREWKRAQLRAEVQRIMALEGDYAAWYYKPTQAKYARMMRGERLADKEAVGSYV